MREDQNQEIRDWELIGFGIMIIIILGYLIRNLIIGRS